MKATEHYFPVIMFYLLCKEVLTFASVDGAIGDDNLIKQNSTHTVVLRAKVSACSGIPYTCSTPGNDMSKPTEQGPKESKCQKI